MRTSKPLFDQPNKQLGAEAAAVEDDRHAALSDQGADLLQHHRQHLHHAGVGFRRDDEERIAALVVDPVIRGGGDGQAALRHEGLGDRVLAVVDADVAIHVEEAQGLAALGDAPFGQGPAKIGGAAHRRQASQFAPERLHLGSAIQTEDPAQCCRRVFFQCFRPLDPQQRHQEHRHQTGAQAVEGRPQRPVDVAGALEHPGLDQRGDPQQNSGARHSLLRAEQRRRVLQHAQIRHQPIDPAVGWIVIEGDRRVVLDAKSGQVWYAPRFGHRRGGIRRRSRRLLQRQRLLLGRRVRPARPAQPFAHRAFPEAEPSSDLAIGMSLAFEPFHAPRERHPRASLWIAIRLPQGGHAAVLKASLISAHRASGTAEDPRDIVLVSPALLDQRHPRVGFGDAVAQCVVRQHDSGDDHDPATVIGAQQTSIIDDLRARRRARNREQLGLSFGVRHGPRYTRAESKKRTGLVRTPCPMSQTRFHSEIISKHLRHTACGAGENAREPYHCAILHGRVGTATGRPIG